MLKTISATLIGLSPQVAAKVQAELRRKRMDYKSITAAAGNNSAILSRKRECITLKSTRYHSYE